MLQNSPVVQPIIPLFIKYIFKNINNDQFKLDSNLRWFSNVIRLIHMLLGNRYLELEPYISHFTSIAITLLLYDYKENEFGFEQNFRQLSRNLLSSIVNIYERSNHDYRIRIAESLISCLLTENMPLNSKYGALFALEEFGRDVIEQFLLPNLPQVLEELKKKQEGCIEGKERLQIVDMKNLIYQISAKAFSQITEESRQKGNIISLKKEHAAIFNDIASYYGYSNFYIFGHNFAKPSS